MAKAGSGALTTTGSEGGGLEGRRVLVLGDDTRSFLAVVRSLGRAGAIVEAAPFDRRSPALTSRHLRATHDLPDLIGSADAWLDAIDHLIAERAIAAVVPCDERTLLPLAAARDRFDGRTALAIPDARAIEVLFDKHLTRDLASATDVAVARGRLLHAGDTADALAAEFGLPLALKPRQSYRTDRLYARNKVRVATTVAALADALDKILRWGEPSEHLVEAFFPGDGLGLSVLAHEGRVVHAFQHRRCHEPSLTGGSSYRVSETAAPDLVAACGRMTAALGFTGIAMFEFRTARPGARGEGDAPWILLEVNARPWGSLPLPVALGVDFPADWVGILLGGPPPEPARYRAGIHGRNLINDLPAVVASVPHPLKRPLGALGAVVARLGEYGRVLIGREVHDTLIVDDPAPGLAEITRYVQRRASQVAGLLPGWSALARTVQRRRARAALARGTGPVVFLCHGNICRSPFAEHAFRAKLGADGPEIVSCGLLTAEGRLSPERAVTAARDFDVDLSGHRSRFLSPELMARARLVIGFDELNEASFRARYPTARVAYVPLGGFADPDPATGGARITDPIDGDLERFRATYRRIDTAVGRLAKQLG